ncbi:MAG: DUF411 domain-containing protein [Gammaproteobacteria bacterium]|nr:DUF411 domain-containing protein [Gammaproteobacteria bacterium]
MNKHISRRILVAGIMLATLIPRLALAESAQPAGLESITVYKSPTCGCCSKWVRHLQDNGFVVEAIDRNDMNTVKLESGIPRQLASCHTAIIGGYLIEGHVPAADIRRLLEERPAVAGLTAPGMPMGSPGMEGHKKDKYDVLTFTRSGDTTVFSRY